MRITEELWSKYFYDGSDNQEVEAHNSDGVNQSAYDHSRDEIRATPSMDTHAGRTNQKQEREDIQKECQQRAEEDVAQRMGLVLRHSRLREVLLGRHCCERLW